MLLNLDNLSEDVLDTLPTLTKELLDKKEKSLIKVEDYISYTRNLSEVARSALVGHKELLILNQVVGALIENNDDLKFFTNKHQLDEVKLYILNKAKEIY